MLCQQHSAPKQINRACVLIGLLNCLLKHRDAAPLDAKDFLKLIPERLRFGTLARFRFPFMNERGGVVANLCLCQLRHCERSEIGTLKRRRQFTLRWTGNLTRTLGERTKMFSENLRVLKFKSL